jgi:hypothetical protein
MYAQFHTYYNGRSVYCCQFLRMEDAQSSGRNQVGSVNSSTSAFSHPVYYFVYGTIIYWVDMPMHLLTAAGKLVAIVGLGRQGLCYTEIA